MFWLFSSIIVLICWGFGDLFNKKSVDNLDSWYSVKIIICTGFAMGVLFLLLFPYSESRTPLVEMIMLYAAFIPAALIYILTLAVSYIGLRYLELSIISPVSNASGGIAALILIFYYLATGRINRIGETISVLELAGVFIITGGIVALFAVQKKICRTDSALPGNERKYKLGVLALIFPLVDCIIDAFGTAIDAVLLDPDSNDGIGEIDYLILYSLLFFGVGIFLWVFLWIRTKKPYNPFRKKERFKCASAVCELLGLIFYVMAISENPVLTAPIVSAYCIVSMILSRVILKEKLSKKQYICVIAVAAGIIMLSVSKLAGAE